MVLTVKLKHPLHDPRINIPGYLALCTLLSVPASLLTLATGSVLPATSLHGSVNALWRLTEAVTRVREESKFSDITKASLAAIGSWGVSIVATTYLITSLP